MLRFGLGLRLRLGLLLAGLAGRRRVAHLLLSLIEVFDRPLQLIAHRAIQACCCCAAPLLLSAAADCARSAVAAGPTGRPLPLTAGRIARLALLLALLALLALLPLLTLIAALQLLPSARFNCSASRRSISC